MKLSQAMRKLSGESLAAYNVTDSAWDVLPFKGLLASTDRRIGRTEAFFNRRIVLTPKEIDPEYQVIIVADSPLEYLIYAHQPNINRNASYIHEYSLLDIESEYADLVSFTRTTYASGVAGALSETVLGSYPVAISRYASANSIEAKGIDYTRVDIFLPTYAAVQPEHVIRLRNEYYDIKEVIVEMRLLHLAAVKR